MDLRNKKDKKPFAETTVGKIFEQVKAIAPDLVKDLIPGKVDDVLIDSLIGRVTNAAEAEPLNPELQKLKHEVQMKEATMRGEAAQHAHEERMEEMRNMHAENLAAIADVSNAREMHAAKGNRDYLLYAVALFILGAVSLMMYVGLFRNLTMEQAQIFARMEGVFFGGGLVMLFQFLFGTNRSSARKTELLSERSK